MGIIGFVLACIGMVLVGLGFTRSPFQSFTWFVVGFTALILGVLCLIFSIPW